MKKLKILIPLLLLGVVMMSSCSGIRATPRGISAGYAASCQVLPVFRVDVEKVQRIGDFDLVNVFLVINGEEIQLNPPTGGSLWGAYKYIGEVPYDGTIRFRYRILSSRTFFSSTSSFYRQSDRYYLRDMGIIKWTGTRVSNIPNTSVSEPSDRLPSKMLLLEQEFLSNFTGTLSQTETLTIRNNATYTVTITQPQIVDRTTGNPLAEMTITAAAGTPTYPLNIAAGGSVDFKLTYTANIDGSGSQVIRQGGIFFNWDDTIRTCKFGPIWVNGYFAPRPS